MDRLFFDVYRNRILFDGSRAHGKDRENMKDKEKLEKIYEIAGLVWDWMLKLERPIIMLIPPIEQIRKLSAPVDCFGTEDCNAIEYGECTRADACSEQAEKNKNVS